MSNPFHVDELAIPNLILVSYEDNQRHASGEVTVTYRVRVDNMAQAQELTGNIKAVLGLGLTSDLRLVDGDESIEDLEERKKSFRLFIDNDGHPLTYGIFRYLIRAAEKRGAEHALASKSRSSKTKSVKRGARPRRRGDR